MCVYLDFRYDQYRACSGLVSMNVYCLQCSASAPRSRRLDAGARLHVCYT